MSAMVVFRGQIEGANVLKDVRVGSYPVGACVAVWRGQMFRHPGRSAVGC